MRNEQPAKAQTRGGKSVGRGHPGYGGGHSHNPSAVMDDSMANQGEPDIGTAYTKSPGHPGGARFGGLINPVHGEQASTDTLPKLTGQHNHNQQQYNR